MNEPEKSTLQQFDMMSDVELQEHIDSKVANLEGDELVEWLLPIYVAHVKPTTEYIQSLGSNSNIAEFLSENAEQRFRVLSQIESSFIELDKTFPNAKIAKHFVTLLFNPITEKLGLFDLVKKSKSNQEIAPKRVDQVITHMSSYSKLALIRVFLTTVFDPSVETKEKKILHVFNSPMLSLFNVKEILLALHGSAEKTSEQRKKIHQSVRDIAEFVINLCMHHFSSPEDKDLVYSAWMADLYDPHRIEMKADDPTFKPTEKFGYTEDENATTDRWLGLEAERLNEDSIEALVDLEKTASDPLNFILGLDSLLSVASRNVLEVFPDNGLVSDSSEKKVLLTELRKSERLLKYAVLAEEKLIEVKEKDLPAEEIFILQEMTLSTFNNLRAIFLLIQAITNFEEVENVDNLLNPNNRHRLFLQTLRDAIQNHLGVEENSKNVDVILKNTLHDLNNYPKIERYLRKTRVQFN
jgi:hypothetical protein